VNYISFGSHLRQSATVSLASSSASFASCAILYVEEGLAKFSLKYGIIFESTLSSILVVELWSRYIIQPPFEIVGSKQQAGRGPAFGVGE